MWRRMADFWRTCVVTCYNEALALTGDTSSRKKKESTVALELQNDELKEHKFEIGQTVFFTSRPIGHMAVNGTYRIVKLLPSEGDDYQYRIKSPGEAFERVAKESQLDRHR